MFVSDFYSSAKQYILKKKEKLKIESILFLFTCFSMFSYEFAYCFMFLSYYAHHVFSFQIHKCTSTMYGNVFLSSHIYFNQKKKKASARRVLEMKLTKREMNSNT